MSKITLAKNIYLIGPMGSGKSSVGYQLEKLTRSTYIDSDAEIEKQTGVTVAWIFEKEKEIGFRKRENEIIKALTQRQNIILSTGGGSILDEENRRCLSSSGLIVYLKVSLEKQFNRVSQRKRTRPLLNQPNPKQKLDELNKSRQAIYEALADIAIDTDDLSPKQVAEAVLKQIT